ncbi:hypothetical protein GDO81_002968 [Engystomops pustulosus]|uniref:Uncharacterized protein n=1 Tax=Engystomops pustulosus TaxID=76066 RepID=A0AAV7DNZ8_ENGPU|nr:hypothetical protein GDO81_002968 [Engystomops pustulosus]
MRTRGCLASSKIYCLCRLEAKRSQNHLIRFQLNQRFALKKDKVISKAAQGMSLFSLTQSLKTTASVGWMILMVASIKLRII